MSQLVTDEIRASIGTSSQPVRVVVTRRAIRQYAVATGQRLRKYLDGDEAPPLFHFDLFREVVGLDRIGRDGLVVDDLIPELPLKRVLQGGQEVTYHRAIAPGDVLVGVRTLRDIYEKAGSQGPLVFFEVELTVTTEAGEPVLTETQTRIAR